MQLPSHEVACCHSPLSLALCVCVAAEARRLSLLLRTGPVSSRLPLSLSVCTRMAERRDETCDAAAIPRGGVLPFTSLSLSLCVCVAAEARRLSLLLRTGPVSSRLPLSLSVCTRMAERREETCDAAAIPRGGVLPFTSLSLSLCVCVAAEARRLSLLLRTGPVSSRLPLSLSVCTRMAERREETCDAAAIPRGGVLPFTSLSLSLCVCVAAEARRLSLLLRTGPVSSRLPLSLSVCTRMAERREETCDAAAIPRGGVLPFTSLSLSLCVCVAAEARRLSLLLRTGPVSSRLPLSLSLLTRMAEATEETCDAAAIPRGGVLPFSSLSLSLCVCVAAEARRLSLLLRTGPVSSRLPLSLSVLTRMAEWRAETRHAPPIPRRGVLPFSSLSHSLRVCGCRGPQALSAAPYRSRFLAAPTVSLRVHAHAWQRGERGCVMQLPSHEEACCHSPLSLSHSLRVCGCRGPQAPSAAPYRSRFLAAPTVSLSVHAHAWRRGGRGRVMQRPSHEEACCHSPLSLSHSLRVCVCRGPQALSSSTYRSPLLAAPTVSLSVHAHAWQRGERIYMMHLPSHEEACCHSPLSLSHSLRVCGCRGPQALSSSTYRSPLLAAPTVSLSVHA